MKYTLLYLRLILTFLLLQTSLSTLAMELIDAKVTAPLKKAYAARYSDPLYCVQETEKYLNKQKSLSSSSKELTNNHKLNNKNTFAIQLKALCYIQLEDYTNALNILHPLLKNPSISANEINALNMVASNIPEEDRIPLSNLMLLQRLVDSEARIEKKTFTNYPNLSLKLLFNISKLSLQMDHYHDALNALEKIKKKIKNKKNDKLSAWLNYYYGLYYHQINQHQLASSSFRIASHLADTQGDIQLSGQVKSSIAKLYQEKYRFPIALNFAKQRVELYINTKNKIKQAHSLIQFAILKRQNNEKDSALIYLFNALELIEKNKSSDLLSHVYLEIGRTYLKNNELTKNSKDLELAQKYLQNARFHFTHLKRTRYQIESLLLLAKLNLINNDPALTILQLQKVLQISTNDYPSLKVQAFEMLALSYEITNNLKQAIIHFKNFHALQNYIKERLFKLQQLQISEQLRLFEKTQQKIQLETKNTQSQKITEQYKTISYSAVGLLTLMIFLFFYLLRNNRKIKKAHKHAQECLTIHPHTKLPFQYTESAHFHYMYNGIPRYYALFNIPFLSQPNELLGAIEATKIEKDLGKSLKIKFNDNIDIFQIRSNQILFISKQKDYKDAGTFAQKIEDFFTSFAKKQQISGHVSGGVVAFPFLNNANRAFNPSRTLDLSGLALFAANQIREDKQQSSWVELYAIDNLQPAFFNGNLWQLGQIAINNGLVKINSSHPEHHLNWKKSD